MTGKPASPAQRAYVDGLLAERSVPSALQQDARRRDLTHEDCTRIIPELQACPRADQDEDWASPEGYDYSPDMGVHQFDGGGSW